MTVRNAITRSAPLGNDMELRDSYNRKIDYLRLSVTDRCNLRCVYCMPKGMPVCPPPSQSISKETILQFVKIARKHGLRKIRLTGGEPLLRGDLIEIIRGIRALGIEDLSLTTNGQMLAGMAKELKAAGIKRVNISLDSLDAQKYHFITGGGSLEKALKSMKVAESHGLSPVKINMVPIRSVNDGDILSFAELSYHNPYQVRFIELMPVGDRAWSEKRRMPSQELLGLIEKRYGRLVPIGVEGVSRNFRIQGASGSLGFISPMSDHFCSTCNRLRITSRGTLKACLFSDNELKIEQGLSDIELEELLLRSIRDKPAGREERACLAKAKSQVGG